LHCGVEPVGGLDEEPYPVFDKLAGHCIDRNALPPLGISIPPATMDAFRDHGRLRPSLEEDVAGAQAVMYPGFFRRPRLLSDTAD